MLGKSREGVAQVEGKVLHQFTLGKLMRKISPDPVPTLDLFIYLLIHLFNKYLLSVCHVSGMSRELDK